MEGSANGADLSDTRNMTVLCASIRESGVSGSLQSGASIRLNMGLYTFQCIEGSLAPGYGTK